MGRRAFNYLLKDEENPKLCYFYYSYYLYMKKYVDPKIILLLFCYYVYNKAYGKYLSYIQVIFNKKLRKRETRYRINPSERPLWLLAQFDIIMSIQSNLDKRNSVKLSPNPALTEMQLPWVLQFSTPVLMILGCGTFWYIDCKKAPSKAKIF